MQDETDKITSLKNYYDKLIKILKNEASFKFAGKAIFDKKRIDDAMCCIDASFPSELKIYKEKLRDVDKTVKTFKLYGQLIASIKNKPPIGTSSYLVRVEEAIGLIEKLKSVVTSDINYIRENFSHLL